MEQSLRQTPLTRGVDANESAGQHVEIGVWSQLTLRERISRVCALRHVLAEDPKPFLDAIELPLRLNSDQTLAAEIIPLADACRFLERRAAAILRPKRLGWSGRPAWLFGVDSEVRREPFGTILIIGPGNYPLMLAGIQAVQALVAGNRVWLKPAPGTTKIAMLFANTLHRLGVPESVLRVLDESPEAITPLLGKIDKVVLTGGSESGRAVLRKLSDHLTPAVMELSGCDSAIVLPDADLDLVAHSLVFGLELNGSRSCIAPRRVLVHESGADDLLRRVLSLVPNLPAVPVARPTIDRLNQWGADAVRQGAIIAAGGLPCDSPAHALILDRCPSAAMLMQSDIAAPLLCFARVRNTEEAIAVTNRCPYRLGASIFGSWRKARDVARLLNVGSVVINDLIAPTVDPRLPFGGCGESGFGSTRGAEGLLEMTQPKAISIRRTGPRFHLLPSNSATAAILRAQLRALHGPTIRSRARGILELINAGIQFRETSAPEAEESA